MKQMLALVLGLLYFATSGLAQDGAAIWKSLLAPVFDPQKTTMLSDLTLVRDRLQLSFSDGSMQFSQPVNGVVYGASFRGHGRVKVEPPNSLEAQQLRLHTGQDSLDMEFTEAVLLFDDRTFEEVSQQAKWQRRLRCPPGTELCQAASRSARMPGPNCCLVCLRVFFAETAVEAPCLPPI